MDDCPRHRRNAVLVSFSLANGDLTALEVQILDSQAECFEQSQPAPVEQHRDQPLVAAQMRHDARHFIDRQHHGQPLGATGANDAFDAVERLLQDMLVEKENRRQRLVLRRRSDVLLDGQVRQKTVDVVFGKFAGMRRS